MFSDIIALSTQRNHVLGSTWVQPPRSICLIKIDFKTTEKMAKTSKEGFAEKVHKENVGISGGLPYSIKEGKG